MAVLERPVIVQSRVEEAKGAVVNWRDLSGVGRQDVSPENDERRDMAV